MKRKETIQVIGDLIAAWKMPLKIKTVTDNLDGTYLLTVTKTYYLIAGQDRTLTIDSVVYTIVEVTDNESILIRDEATVPTAPPVVTFDLPVPKYFNGTIVVTGSEISGENDLSKKTPMVYLRRPFSETVDAQDLNNTDVANEADLTLYFLTEAQFDAWSTAQHDTFAVKPMRNMMYAFIEMLKSNANGKYVERLTNYEAMDMIKFGVYVQNGYEKAIWSDNYSGVEMRITLGLKYQCYC